MDRSQRGAIVVCVIVAGVISGVSGALTVLLERLMVGRGATQFDLLVSGLLFLVPGIPGPGLAGRCVDRAPSRRCLSGWTIAAFATTLLLQLLTLAVLESPSTSMAALDVLLTLYGILSTCIGTLCLSVTNQWVADGSRAHAAPISAAYAWISTSLSLVLTVLFTSAPLSVARGVYYAVTLVSATLLVPLTVLEYQNKLLSLRSLVATSQSRPMGNDGG